MNQRSAVASGDLAVDRRQSDIARSFSFLLDLTPTNVAEARKYFSATGRTPHFEYRPIAYDIGSMVEELASVKVDTVADPALASLFLEKQRELRLQLEMLACRDTESFLPLSIELYGTASPTLVAEAEAILATLTPPGAEPGAWLDAYEFVEAARSELDHYRRIAPGIETRIEIRDAGSGVMVSNGDVVVASTVRIAPSRLDALLQHEIGTHVVTYINGAHQPLTILAGGLAGHDETQEGLAVLAEYLVGGLSASRLREIAARVIAVRDVVTGAEFPDVHHRLVEAGITAHQAFAVTMRVFRAGGFTKDAIYLRGLRELVDHLAAGGEMQTLLLGKMPLTAVPLVTELNGRGVLSDPLLRPRYLDDRGARDRLAAIHEVASLTEMIEGRP